MNCVSAIYVILEAIYPMNVSYEAAYYCHACWYVFIDEDISWVMPVKIHDINNQPTLSHYSCSFYQPFDGKIRYDGWWNHDGAKFDGNLVKVHDISEVLDKKPRILFYEKNH
jgi:hypothetical protein